MKLRTLVLAMTALLGAGCMSMNQPKSSLRIEPVMAVRHASADAHSYYQLGRYYQGQSRLDRAEEAYLKAISIDERHVDALNALGSLYAERGELERSAQMFEKVTAMAPEAAYLYNNLGFAYYLLGRFDDAYVAVRAALKLDQALERGWANIERIVDRNAPPALVEAVHQRRLDALPNELAAAPMTPGGESTEVVAALRIEPSLVSVTTITTPNPVMAAIAVKVEEVPDSAVPPTAMQAPACPQAAPDSALPAFRLEVSNGNGVRHFARKFSSQLDSAQLPVARITNHASFTVKQTQVEYQPGFQTVACSLLAHAGASARLVSATTVRPGSDVRIVLGRDIIPAG